MSGGVVANCLFIPILSKQRLSFVCHHDSDLAANILGSQQHQHEHEEESTSGVSTFDSSTKPPELQREKFDRLDNQDLQSQLQELEQENRRYWLQGA